ncbi:DUF6316 family protein [Pleionea litopenaei]|uniref:DUF6316 family protein n=1 Tax=Pleionea litopenaei TaxID=3070815 RepID=A0AA51X5J6_9GAMM|nr:DUF6316 family protein [Pleionea sp. HL-JVS1]WMS85691.1 DUF6316 family protein [Pleionea sp. HL-JVS1]
MKTLDSLKNEHQYSIFYRSSRVYKTQDQWFFESAEGDAFGPFDSKDTTMRAVRIYKDVKQQGINLPFAKIQKVI